MIPLILPGADLSAERLSAAQWPDAVHHVARVRRVRVEEQLLLGDGAGKRVQVTVAELDKESITITDHVVLPEQPRPRVTLWLSVIEKSALEEACHLVSQVGVRAIHLVTTEFTCKDLRLPQEERLQKIILNSCIQSEQAWLPELHMVPVALRDLPWDDGVWYAAVERSREADTSPAGDAHVLIGPEGGWSHAEREFLLDGRAQVLDLGPSILRAQTAALIGCWAVVHHRKTIS